MKKYIVLAIFVVALFVTPALAQTSIADQIAELQKIVADLQIRLAELLRQQQRPELSCHDFTTDLSQGMVGGGVIGLKWALREDDYYPTLMDGIGSDHLTFDSQTFAAVKKFQAKYGIPDTGYVGPLTRVKLNELYGCNKRVFITPSALGNAKVGESYGASLQAHGFGVPSTQTWKFNVVSGNLPPGLTFQAAILCSDPGPDGFIPGQSYGCHPTENASIYGIPTTAGIYTFTIQATNGAQTATQTYTLRVLPKEIIEIPPVTLIAPNGGENWEAGSGETITWKFASTRNQPKVDLYLEAEPPGCIHEPTPCVLDFVAERFLLDRNIAGTRYGWVVATEIDRYDLSISPGVYRVEVCAAGTTNCDRSDRAFTITDPAPTVISVTSPNGDETWAQGSRQTISWRGASSAPTNVSLVSYSANEACRKAGGEICPQDVSQIYSLVRNTTRSNYSWTTDATPGRYWVRVCQSNVCDDSDRTFTITE